MAPIPIHVLHIEDDPVSAALTPALLAKSRQARFEMERGTGWLPDWSGKTPAGWTWCCWICSCRTVRE